MTTFCSISSKKVIILGSVASMMLNFREHLIRDLVAKGCEVYCLAQGYSDQDRKVISDWGGVTIESPLNSKGLNPFKDIVALIRLFKIFRQISPDVVFSYFVKPVIYGTIAAKLAKVPRVIGMIEGLGNAFTRRKDYSYLKADVIKNIQVFLYRISLPRLNCLILLNNDDKKDLLDHYKIAVKRLEVLGGIGLDLQKFPYSQVSNRGLVFIFIGRLLKEKGIFEYLEAAKEVRKKYPETTFYVLGGFDSKNPFALKSTELDDYLTDGTVVHPGHVDNVPEWIAKSSVFVLPSYREGFPRSTQEAMAIGRPIITTDSVGCRETVEDGVNGFLVPPFSVTALIEKMEWFIQHPDKINEMGRESRVIAEQHYDVYKVNKKLISVLFDDD